MTLVWATTSPVFTLDPAAMPKDTRRERRTETVTAFSFDQYDDEAPKALDEFIETLREVSDEIPEQFRASAVVALDTDYDGYKGEFSVTYERPETDEAYARRLAAYDYEARNTEQRERAMYEHLRKKYEPARKP